jgi:hypothetical protein
MKLTEFEKKLPVGAVTAEATENGCRLKFDTDKVVVHHTADSVEVWVKPKE